MVFLKWSVLAEGAADGTWKNHKTWGKNEEKTLLNMCLVLSWLFQGTRHITNPVKRQRLDQGMSLGLDKLKRSSGFGYGDYNSGKRGFDGGAFDQGFGGFSVMKKKNYTPYSWFSKAMIV